MPVTVINHSVFKEIGLHCMQGSILVLNTFSSIGWFHHVILKLVERFPYLITLCIQI